MRFSWKNIETWLSWKMRFFESAILIFFASSQWKHAAHSYEVSFISVIWIFFSESWKRLHPNWYAHDCSVLRLHQTRSYQNPHLGQCCKKWDRVQPLRLFRAHKLPINAWTFSPQVVFYGISKSLGYSCCLAFWKPEFQVCCNSVVGESVKLQNLFCF